jgi:hemerythrin-like domain-containing protein
MKIKSASCVDEEQEQPLELLFACHERVRRFAGLTGRLAVHVREKGADAEAQQAADNVLRYFEQALPRHHDDEEIDVFPALRKLRDAQVDAAIDSLLLEHESLNALWARVHPWLAQISAGRAPEAEPIGLRDFVIGYPEHAAHEERDVFPALARLPAEEIERIAAAMRGRRDIRA